MYLKAFVTAPKSFNLQFLVQKQLPEEVGLHYLRYTGLSNPYSMVVDNLHMEAKAR